MRPHALSPLFRPISSLAGIGPKIAGLFGRLLGNEADAEPRVLTRRFLRSELPRMRAGLADTARFPRHAAALSPWRLR